MYQPRKVEKYGLIRGVKIYSIVKDGKELEGDAFLARMQAQLPGISANAIVK